MNNLGRHRHRLLGVILALGRQDSQALGVVGVDIFMSETADAHPQAALLYATICAAVLSRTSLLPRRRLHRAVTFHQEQLGVTDSRGVTKACRRSEKLEFGRRQVVAYQAGSDFRRATGNLKLLWLLSIIALMNRSECSIRFSGCALELFLIAWRI